MALGSGIFKSVDAGKNWSQVWKGRGQIGTMAIDPKNSDIALAAVLGSPFGPGKERGVYRTTDGGKSWQQVLYVDERTGASDVAFDPNNSHILYAGMWQTERRPWTMTSGGPGSGLYRSTDGGESWQRLKGKGLPDGEWGKVGVRVAPSELQHCLRADRGQGRRAVPLTRRWRELGVCERFARAAPACLVLHHPDR